MELVLFQKERANQELLCLRNQAKTGRKSERDLTGQTDTSLNHMKQRLAEVPKKSAGNKHDKTAYEDNE